jgi:hypothetical protein
MLGLFSFPAAVPVPDPVLPVVEVPAVRPVWLPVEVPEVPPAIDPVLLDMPEREELPKELPERPP